MPELEPAAGAVILALEHLGVAINEQVAANLRATAGGPRGYGTG